MANTRADILIVGSGAAGATAAIDAASAGADVVVDSSNGGRVRPLIGLTA
jgi:thioredoxin reductase